MSMDEAPPRSFMVMKDILCHYDCEHERRWLDWEVVQCKRVALGCEPADKKVLDGISLCVLRGDDDDDDPEHYPDMCIRLTDDVLFHVEGMIDDDMADIWGRRDISISCYVCVVEGDIMVSRLAFTARHGTGPFRAYYLVYNDSANASLSMIPAHDPQCRPIAAICPLPLRRQDGGYSLLFLESIQSQVTLETLSDIPQDDMDQWVVKDRPNIDDDPFRVDKAFSCNGNAIWCDLTQGIMYCSYTDILKGRDCVNSIKYIRLPKEHRIPQHVAMMMGNMHARRNMGLVGNSIWFVSITPSDSDTGNTMVEVWTLDLTQPLPKEEKKEWAIHIGFRLQSIWELDAFTKMGLSKSLPWFPILRQQDDGVFYMLLPDLAGKNDHLVGIDVGRSRDEMPQIVSARRLAVPWIYRPVVLPLDFFQNTCHG